MKKDIYDFLKAHHIAKSVEESIREGKLKDVDIAEQEFLENITSEEFFSKNSTELEDVYRLRDEKGFSVKIRAREHKYRMMRSVRRVVISGAVAAAILAVSFYLLNNNETLPVVELANVETQTDVPVLITPMRTIILAGAKKDENHDELVKLEEQQSVYVQRLIVPNGFTYTVMLSDSTEVIVNAGSELSYASKFVGDKREVALKGEAYFKVKKDSKPFLVTVGGVTVKVYGTQFNINSYNEDKIQTVLISGSVGVTYLNNDEEIILKPAQMATVDRQGKIDLQNAPLDKLLAWTRGEIINDCEPLSHFLDNLARWYGVEFDFSEEIGNMTMSAEIKNERPLDEILKSIEIISGVKIDKFNDKKYMIRK